MAERIHKSLFPLLRRLSDGRFHSGEALAREFGLSRASISNVLGQAAAVGLAVHAVRGRGYRLPEVVEWLDCGRVAALLGPVAKAYRLACVDTLASTNTALMTGVPGMDRDGSVLCAEHQQAGKGRRGRDWHSVVGGSLTFSVLWRFDNGLQSLGGLSLAAGLAVARAVNRHSSHPARLKWPNDVLVGYRKLAGILVEVQGDPLGAAIAVVGVGLNVRLGPGQRDAVDQALVDLAEMGVTAGRNQLLADCLKELDGVMTRFRRDGFAALREDWLALDAYAGKHVSLRFSENRRVSGVAAGVDATGALLLRDRQSQLHAYNGGEISLRLEAAS